ncbi:MAG: protein adenylyltransferase SelO family protein, partial [Myxococcales bacterium]|nr:protein adenylyltransferase SelO family protein [Myxococcales bacterium]
YPETFEKTYREMMMNKLGLGSFRHEEDDALIAELFGVLQATVTDMTIFYRRLANVDPAIVATQTDDQRIAPLLDAYYAPAELDEEITKRIGGWLRSYAERLLTDDLPATERRAKMNRVNPKYVLRNYLAQLAIDKAEAGNPTMVDELLDVMRRPYDEQPERAQYAEKRPDWARTRPGCSALSCSS